MIITKILDDITNPDNVGFDFRATYDDPQIRRQNTLNFIKSLYIPIARGIALGSVAGGLHSLVSGEPLLQSAAFGAVTSATLDFIQHTLRGYHLYCLYDFQK